jgi:tetratricopeptide (TPR) repeat protein
MARRFIIAGLLAAAAVPSLAQFLPTLQAKTPEEFDGYLLVAGATEPAEIVQSAARFARQWPSSELAVRVFELQLEAYRKLGDAKGALAAGERGLAAAKDYIPLLVAAAYIEANESSDPARLAVASWRAKRALELLGAATASRDLRPPQWEFAVARAASTAHATLGMVAFKGGQAAIAIGEFEQALKLHPPPPDPAQQYRLALLYREQGKTAEARSLLEIVASAASAADPLLRELARKALQQRAPDRRK